MFDLIVWIRFNVHFDFCAGCECSADQGTERGD